MKIAAFLAPGQLRRNALLLILFGAMVSPSPPAAAASSQPVTILAFGDSLTAGYGLETSESYPVQLQMALAAKGHKVSVVNAGVSGDTTSGGLARLDWTLNPKPDAVILELGANDALRGLDPNVPRENLDRMLAALKAKGIPVLLAGMRAPGNWGDDYARNFDGIFRDLATKYNVSLYPFFLDGVALDPSLTQPDGLHPTAKGVAEIVKRMLPEVEALLARVPPQEAHKKPESP